MDIKSIIRKSLFEGYATSDIQIGTIFICILFTVLIAVYIYFVYKAVTKNSFYNRNFNLSLIGMAVITAAIILTIQSNIVVSLGMVGALSIVRYRTAVKDPIDLFFLFWSISAGIICGAGFAMIAVIASAVLSAIIIILTLAPAAKEDMVLVVNADSYEVEDQIMRIIRESCKYAKIKARNVSKSGINLAVSVRLNSTNTLIPSLMELESVKTASLVEYDGDITV